MRVRKTNIDLQENLSYVEALLKMASILNIFKYLNLNNLIYTVYTLTVVQYTSTVAWH